MPRMSYLAIVLGAFGAYIAWKQWKTSHLKLKLDLFDRRMRVYLAALESFKAINDTGGVSNEIYFNMVQAIGEAEFLFPQPIVTYLRNLLDATRQHRTLGRRIERAMQIEDQEKVSNLDIEQNELEISIEKKMASITENFRPYMDFRDVR
jgi:hypothetical protein